MFDWSAHSWIIVLVGFLAAVSCSLLGIFLVLRRMSLVADAISHAVLPGIAIAFLLTGSREPVTMLLGAGAVGVLATFLIEWVHRRGGIQADAAIGIVFTSLFALGVVIISAKAGMVDLDQDCVLYGEIAYSPWDTLVIGGKSLGVRPLWILGFIAIINMLFIGLFFKELKLSTFDPALATTLGFSAMLLHYALMGLVSLTTVAAFEVVGAILVVAMFVIPAATAYLLTDRLALMVLWAVVISAGIALGGYAMARALDASIAGSMSMVAGLFFLAAFLLSPSHGVIPRAAARWKLKLRIAVEDWLAHTWRRRESVTPSRHDPDASQFMRSPWLPLLLRWKRLAKKRDGGEWILTDAGSTAAAAVIRRHRSWEGFLYDEFGVPADHVHRPAHDAEHFLTEDLTGIGEVVTPDRKDPHSSEIPG